MSRVPKPAIAIANQNSASELVCLTLFDMSTIWGLAEPRVFGRTSFAEHYDYCDYMVYGSMEEVKCLANTAGG